MLFIWLGMAVVVTAILGVLTYVLLREADKSPRWLFVIVPIIAALAFVGAVVMHNADH